VGTATGAMNFFRALASTLAVAVMGAILLAGLGATPERGTGVELLVETAGRDGIDMAAGFRWLFVAGGAFVGLPLGAGRAVGGSGDGGGGGRGGGGAEGAAEPPRARGE